jgi:hypothetical protein
MNTLLTVVFAAFLIQIATSFAPQIRIRNCNAITKRTSSPFTVVYSSNGPPELQPNDEEPQVVVFKNSTQSLANQFVYILRTNSFLNILCMLGPSTQRNNEG